MTIRFSEVLRGGIEEDADGKFCLFSEIAALEAENTRLREENAALKETVSRRESLLDKYADSEWKRNKELATANQKLHDWENAEASVCPEDVGFVEFIGVLQKKLQRALAQNPPQEKQ